MFVNLTMRSCMMYSYVIVHDHACGSCLQDHVSEGTHHSVGGRRRREPLGDDLSDAFLFSDAPQK